MVEPRGKGSLAKVQETEGEKKKRSGREESKKFNEERLASRWKEKQGVRGSRCCLTRSDQVMVRSAGRGHGPGT